MPLYGSVPLGSAYYGAETQRSPLFGLKVYWERLGYYTGRNEARRLNSFTIRRGRRHYVRTNGDGFEQEDTGSLTATIADPDREFFPFNTSSPLYGLVASNRRMTMDVRTSSADKFDLFTGNISRVNPVDGTIPEVTLEAVDGWELLRGQKSNITVVLQEDVYADEILPLILNKAGYPTDWGYDLNSGLDVQPYWWVDKKNAADAIFDIVHSELGRTFIKGNGALAFRNRYFVEDPVVTITDEDYLWQTFEFVTPWEIQRNVVTVVVKPRSLKSSQVLWSLPQVTPINNGQSYEFYPEFKYNNEIVPAKDVLDPVGTANTLEDGAGTDLSSGLSVTKEALGNRVKVTVTNNSGSNGFLRTLTVSGKPIANDAEVPLQKSNIGTREDVLEFRLDLPWIQNIQRADGFKDFMLDFLSPTKQYIKLTLKPKSPDLNSQFEIDLGRVVRVNSTRYDLDTNYSIAYIEHKYQRKLDHTYTTLYLEPLPDVENYWRFGFSAFGISTKFAP